MRQGTRGMDAAVAPPLMELLHMYGMVWYGMVQYGSRRRTTSDGIVAYVWYGMVWYGTVWTPSSHHL